LTKEGIGEVLTDYKIILVTFGYAYFFNQYYIDGKKVSKSFIFLKRD